MRSPLFSLFVYKISFRWETFLAVGLYWYFFLTIRWTYKCHYASFPHPTCPLPSVHTLWNLIVRPIHPVPGYFTQYVWQHLYSRSNLDPPNFIIKIVEQSNILKEMSPLKMREDTKLCTLSLGLHHDLLINPRLSEHILLRVLVWIFLLL